MEPDREFYKAVLDHVGDGVYFVDRERRISYWSRGAERITGYMSEDVLGRPCSDGILVHVDDRGDALCATGCPLAATMTDGEAREAQVYLHHAEGHRLPVALQSVPMYGVSGEITGAVQTFSDNSRLQAALKRIGELRAVAMRDALTGIGNRRSLESRMRACLRECRRSSSQVGVLLVDVDHFKSVNDRHGHDAGDRVLKMVANTLTHNIRASDTVGRWGGEEFMALVSGVDEARLTAAADKLRMLVASSFLDMPSGRLSVTISLGATLARRDDNPSSLLTRADSLLYRSKAEGRDRVTFSQ